MASNNSNKNESPSKEGSREQQNKGGNQSPKNQGSTSKGQTGQSGKTSGQKSK